MFGHPACRHFDEIFPEGKAAGENTNGQNDDTQTTFHTISSYELELQNAPSTNVKSYKQDPP
jgi:hypothetical protein